MKKLVISYLVSCQYIQRKVIASQVAGLLFTLVRYFVSYKNCLFTSDEESFVDAFYDKSNANDENNDYHNIH